jgi:hypothetical protein
MTWENEARPLIRRNTQEGPVLFLWRYSDQVRGKGTVVEVSTVTQSFQLNLTTLGSMRSVGMFCLITYILIFQQSFNNLLQPRNITAII